MDKIFLMATERSGSNFITKLLDAHSQVCGPSTKHILNPLFRNVFRYEPLSKKSNRETLIKDILNLFNVNFSVWKSDFTFSELVGVLEKSNLKSLIDYIYEKEAIANGKSILFIKEIKIYEFIPFLMNLYPDAKYVYLVRDPRDFALSWKKSKIHKGGVVAAARQWKTDQQQYLKFGYLLRGKEKLLQLKYEKLINESESELEKVSAFIGVEFEKEMFDFYKDENTLKNAKSLDAWGNLNKSVMVNNSGKFKTELTEEEIIIIEKICCNEMDVFGYETVFSETEIENLPNERIVSLGEIESKVPYEPSIGVVENMKAKKAFYEKRIIR